MCDVIVPDPAPVPLKQRLHEDRHCLGRVLQQEVCANPEHLECRFRRYDWQVIFYKKNQICFYLLSSFDISSFRMILYADNPKISPIYIVREYASGQTSTGS